MLEKRRKEELRQEAELQKNYELYQASKADKYANQKLWQDGEKEEYNKFTNMIDHVLGSPEKDDKAKSIEQPQADIDQEEAKETSESWNVREVPNNEEEEEEINFDQLLGDAA